MPAVALAKVGWIFGILSPFPIPRSATAATMFPIPHSVYRSQIALFSNGPIGNIPGQFSQTGIAGAHNQDNFPAPWFNIYIRQELLPVCH